MAVDWASRLQARGYSRSPAGVGARPLRLRSNSTVSRASSSPLMAMLIEGWATKQRRAAAVTERSSKAATK